MSPRILDYLRRHIGPVRRDLRVLEIGSLDSVGGGIADYFRDCDYTGLDISPGKNVDILVKNERWTLAGKPFDWVVSVNTFEHVQRPWVLMPSMRRVIGKSGKILIVAPFSFPYHRHPVDCWRYTPDSLLVLARECGLAVETAYLDYEASALYGTISDFVWHLKRRDTRNAFKAIMSYPTRMPAWNCVGVIRRPIN